MRDNQQLPTRTPGNAGALEPYGANEKRERDNAKLAQEKHRQEIRRALRTAPPLKTDGLSTLGYQQ